MPPAPSSDRATSRGVFDLVRTLAADPEGSVACTAVAAAMAPWFPVVSVTLFVVCPQARHLDSVGNWGEEGWRLGFATFDLTLSVPVTEAFRSGEPLHLTRDEVASQFPLSVAHLPVRAEGAATLLVLPLWHATERIGVARIWSSAAIEQADGLDEALDAVGDCLVLWLARSTQVRPVRDGADFVVTDRQRIIIGLLRDDLTNIEIADALGYSVATVKAEIAALSRLLGARGRRAVVAQADRVGL